MERWLGKKWQRTQRKSLGLAALSGRLGNATSARSIHLDAPEQRGAGPVERSAPAGRRSSCNARSARWGKASKTEGHRGQKGKDTAGKWGRREVSGGGRAVSLCPRHHELCTGCQGTEPACSPGPRQCKGQAPGLLRQAWQAPNFAGEHTSAHTRARMRADRARRAAPCQTVLLAELAAHLPSGMQFPCFSQLRANSHYLCFVEEPPTGSVILMCNGGEDAVRAQAADSHMSCVTEFSMNGPL